MASPDDHELVDDEEKLYRRIPECWYKAATKFIDPLAFKPSESDVTGLSVGRASFHPPEDEAARGRRGKRYYVAVLAASDVRRLGGTVIGKAEYDNPGHAEIPELTYAARKSDKAVELMQGLRDSVITVEGPFDGGRAQPGFGAAGDPT